MTQAPSSPAAPEGGGSRESRQARRLPAPERVGCLHSISDPKKTDDASEEPILGELQDLSREGACIIAQLLRDDLAARLVTGTKLRCILFGTSLAASRSLQMTGHVRWFEPGTTDATGESKPARYGVSWDPRSPFDHQALADFIASQESGQP